jgi:hypothetical protein
MSFHSAMRSVLAIECRPLSMAHERDSNMARPVDYRKGRGSKGVHTEDEHLPIGKKGQARNSDSTAQRTAPPDNDVRASEMRSKHSTGHMGQKAKPRHE